MRVAVIGTGLMGAPMARNIAAAGHDVRVWNRTRAKAEGLGAAVCDTPAEAAAGADVVLTMLSAGGAVAEVMKDLLPGLDGAVWAQMSTVGVEATDQLLARAADAGVDYVDAPVLGTKAPAEQGRLTVLAAGPPAARERCGPVFEAVGARTIELGDAPGGASRMKLVLNGWVLALNEGLAESVALAEQLGVDPRSFLAILDGAPMGSPYAQLKGAAMIDRVYEASFPLELAVKDALLVEDAARAAGLNLPLPRVIAEQMQRAVDAGHGRHDMAATVEASRR